MAKKKAEKRVTIAMWTDEHRRCIVANKRADAAEAEVLRSPSGSWTLSVYFGHRVIR